MVVGTATSGHLGGSVENDVLTGVAQNGTSQIHIYGQAGDDVLNLDFAGISSFSHGHHVRGDGSNGQDDRSTDRGADTFNFMNLDEVRHVVVGRIEDFDASRDSLTINGSRISLEELAGGIGITGGYFWRVVEYDSDPGDANTDSQQWILIDSGQGYVFYALEGARVADGDGGANDGNQEAHFIRADGVPLVPDFIPIFGFVDPQNYVPAGYTAQGGVTINDDDNVYADALRQINGTGGGDLIAAGLNDDSVRAAGGDDHVWGGSGNDTLYGDNGDDTIQGGTGNDKIIGGRGDDVLFGENGDDILNGWGGDDHQHGGIGNDSVYGQQGDDTLNGGEGDDVLFGSTDNDILLGENGDDLLNGGQGSDTLTGGDGADTFEFKRGDLMNWNDLEGSWADKNAQLDLITDFTIGLDRIEFDGFSSVNSMSDLRGWKTTIDGNVHYTVRIKSTNERILVDVEDSVGWGSFFNADNFLFG